LNDKAKYNKWLAALQEEGILSSELSDAGRYINTQRRDVYAAGLEERKITNKGEWLSGAGARSPKKRVAANKIRKSASQQKEESSLKHALEHIAHEINPHPHEGGGAAHPPTPPATHTPTPTGGTPQAGGDHTVAH
jgi:hypothetical protein